MNNLLFPFFHLQDIFADHINDNHQSPLHVLTDLTYDPLDDNLPDSVDSHLLSNLDKEVDCKYYFCEDSQSNLLQHTFNLMFF